MKLVSLEPSIRRFLRSEIQAEALTVFASKCDYSDSAIKKFLRETPLDDIIPAGVSEIQMVKAMAKESESMSQEDIEGIVIEKKACTEMIQSSYRCIVDGSHFELGDFEEMSLIQDREVSAEELLDEIRAMKAHFPYREMSIGFRTRFAGADPDITDVVLTLDTGMVNGKEVTMMIPWTNMTPPGSGVRAWRQFPFSGIFFCNEKCDMKGILSEGISSIEARFPVSISNLRVDYNSAPDEGAITSIAIFTTLEEVMREHSKVFNLDCEGVRRESHDMARVLSGRAIMFLYLINTRGISTESVEYPKSVNKKRVKHGKKPLQSYKVLKFDLPKHKVVRDDNGEHHHVNRRLHTCHGHTRFYGPDKPLFGHYVGPVWVPQHIRGNREEGLIVKDYEKK